MSDRGVRRPLAAIAVMSFVAFAADLAAAPDDPVPRLPCHAHDEIARQLDRRYGEQPVSIGLQANGNLLQVFISDQTGSWTILSTTPAGLACILAAGRGWENLPPRRAGPAI